MMPVHIGEIHTDVSGTGGTTPAGAAATASGETRSRDDVWRESRGRVEWLARRIRAEGFSD